MTRITITQADPIGGLHLSKDLPNGRSAVVLNETDQRDLLEIIARTQGFTLVDSEERKGLLELAEEIDEDPNDYGQPTTAWAAWQDRAEALASAVRQALGTDQ